MLISISACLAGCAKTVGDFCDLASPIKPTAEAVAAMSDREKADILKHNEFGEEKCGWTP
jgi:hypothetical protein